MPVAETEIKRRKLIEHGNTYYVNEPEFKRAEFIRKSSWIWFLIVWLIIFFYVRKNQPDYFKSKRTR